MSLQVTNLTKKFGEQTALNNINLSIEKNEIVGLLGPNGAGKSTLMKSITGVVKIDEGEILFNDKNITQYPIESKKNIGFLPENNPLYQEMFVKEYLNSSSWWASLPKNPKRFLSSPKGINRESGWHRRFSTSQICLSWMSLRTD